MLFIIGCIFPNVEKCEENNTFGLLYLYCVIPLNVKLKSRLTKFTKNSFQFIYDRFKHYDCIVVGYDHTSL